MLALDFTSADTYIGRGRSDELRMARMHVCVCVFVCGVCARAFAWCVCVVCVRVRLRGVCARAFAWCVCVCVCVCVFMTN